MLKQCQFLKKCWNTRRTRHFQIWSKNEPRMHSIVSRSRPGNRTRRDLRIMRKIWQRLRTGWSRIGKEIYAMLGLIICQLLPQLIGVIVGLKRAVAVLLIRHRLSSLILNIIFKEHRKELNSRRLSRYARLRVII